MKKFLTLCVLFSMLLFVTPALTADVNEVDLGSNLSFTFEPSSMTAKPLTIIPFANLDLSLSQNEEEPIKEIKKNDLFPIPVVFGIMLVALFSLNMSMGASI